MTLDVRDMLCAQALALTDRTIKALPAGGVLALRCNSQDVVRDVQVWAADRGHTVLSTESLDEQVVVTLQRAR
jgi:TusA-related sulfurtransferase